MILFTKQIVAAYLKANPLPVTELPGLIRSTYAALLTLGEAQPPSDIEQLPAVPVKKSVTPDYIVCLEDGKKLKMLKRHLQTAYNMTPEEYRAKWNLPSDYPMTAPSYSSQRSEMALRIGLGKPAAKTRKGK